MNAAPSQSLINLLLESGVPSTEEAAELATNLNGGSWVSQVLDSGKVEEQRFLSAIGNFFRVPIVSVDAKKIERTTLSIALDRKSTRLNSSHVSTSYAVFCLKKKKKRCDTF